jgi:ketosteroid isomerase-like protein
MRDMKGIIMRRILLVLIASIAASHHLIASEMSSEAEVAGTLQAYESAWSRHDADAIASFYYEPAVRVGRAGPHVRPSRADQISFFNGFLQGLVDRGYASSTWEELNVRLLDEQTAIAGGITVRYRADGTVFERLGVTYGLYKTNEGWKIFMSATHAPESVLRFQ